jgi:hypothetical protein
MNSFTKQNLTVDWAFISQILEKKTNGIINEFVCRNKSCYNSNVMPVRRNAKEVELWFAWNELLVKKLLILLRYWIID